MAEPDDPDSLPTQQWTGPPDVPMTPGQPLSDSAFEGMLGARDPRTRGWQPPTAEELQPHLPQYQITELLGRGGMGAVYKGWQRSLDRFVAIKILPPGLESGDVDFAARFKREARAMAKLKHPGIIPVHDAGETADGLLYFVMDFVEGTDVQKMLAARGKLPAEEALAIAANVLVALAYAHQRGIIHRDITPANIMVDDEGNVLVADFGLARSTGPDTTMLTMSNMAMGTPDFMAPESHLGMAHVDHRADLFAVGVMLYQMLTGKLPRGRFDPPSRAVPGLDKRLDAIVDRTLQNERDARYSSALEMRAALDPILTRTIAKRVAATRQATASRWKPLLIGLAIVVALGVGGIIWQQIATTPPPEAEALKLAEGRDGSPSRPGALGESALPESAIGSTTTPDRIAALAANPANWVDRLKTRKWEGAWLLKDGVLTTTDQTKALSHGLATMQDGAVRVRARATRLTSLQLQLILRVGGAVRGKPDFTGTYQFQIDTRWGASTLSYYERHKGVATTERREDLWSNVPLAAAIAGQTEIEWEFRAVGDELSAWANGRLIKSIRDPRGLVRGSATLTSDTALEITRVETIDFASASASSQTEALKIARGRDGSPSRPSALSESALPAAASQDAPFVNSLGMQFIPVPITDGPTGGQRVLFSVWETRVQDYETFIKDLRRKWMPAGFEQGPAHPAVRVTWQDVLAPAP